jgi:hypothetical protein
MATTTKTTIYATIYSAKHCVGHLGSEEWAIRTICAVSDLDVHPEEVQILRNVRNEGGTGMRYVLSGGTILGSYTLAQAE